MSTRGGAARWLGPLTALLAATALASAFWWWLGTHRIAAAEASLDVARVVHAQALQQRRDRLVAQVRRLADDPAVVAYVSAALSRPIVDTVSIRDLLEERMREHGIAATALFDASGERRLATGALLDFAATPLRLPALDDLFAQAAERAGWWRHERQAMQFALAPFRQGPLAVGVLAVAQPVTGADLAEIAANSGVEAQLVAVQDGQASVIAVSDPGLDPAAAAVDAAALAESAPDQAQAGAADVRLLATLPEGQRAAWQRQQRLRGTLAGGAFGTVRFSEEGRLSLPGLSQGAGSTR